MKSAAASAFVTGLLCVSATAQAQSTRAEFEKLGLIGTHTIDCSQPVSATNGYIIYRVLDDTRILRNTMVGPTNSRYVSIAESVSAPSPNEITVTGTTEGKKLEYTIRVDGPKHRVWSWTEDGVQSVENGVWTDEKYEMPWLNKCS